MQDSQCRVRSGSVTMRSKSRTTHFSNALGQPLARVPWCNVHMQCGGVMQEFECRLPLGSAAVYCPSLTAHYPPALQRCNARLPLPLPLGSVAVWSTHSAAYRPEAVRQFVAGFPLPTTHTVISCPKIPQNMQPRVLPSSGGKCS